MKQTLAVISLLFSSLLVAKNSVSLDSLQGAWECVYSVYDDPNLNHDAMPPYDLDSPDMVWIEHDTLFELNYPCYMNSVYRITIKHDTLREVSASYDPSKGPPCMNSFFDDFPARVFLRNDTFIRITGEYGGAYTEKQYVRTSVDTTQIRLLKKNRIDLKCITGTWKLETSYDSGYDGNGIVDYDFPFVPQSVIIFTENSRTDYSNNTLWLKADGVARPFYIVDLSADGTVLDVETQGWYKDRWPWELHYRKVD